MTTPPSTACCDLSSASVTRRGLFRAAAATGGVMTFGSAVVATASATPGIPASSVIVVLSLRGAADGLSLVVPHGDPTYYAARPTIAVPATSLLAADATFGLHPSLEPLLPMWDAGKLAAVHATGMQVPNRSHFAAMEAVEDAHPGSSARVGWLEPPGRRSPRHLTRPGAQRRLDRDADLALRPGAGHGGHGPATGRGERSRGEHRPQRHASSLPGDHVVPRTPPSRHRRALGPGSEHRPRRLDQPDTADQSPTTPTSARPSPPCRAS